MFRGSKKKSWESHSNPVKNPTKNLGTSSIPLKNIRSAPSVSLWPRTPLGSNSLALHPKESGFENSATFDHSNITYRATNSGSRVLLVLGETSSSFISKLGFRSTIWDSKIHFGVLQIFREEVCPWMQILSAWRRTVIFPNATNRHGLKPNESFICENNPNTRWSMKSSTTLNWYLNHSKFKMSGFLFFPTYFNLFSHFFFNLFDLDIFCLIFFSIFRFLDIFLSMVTYFNLYIWGFLEMGDYHGFQY